MTFDGLGATAFWTGSLAAVLCEGALAAFGAMRVSDAEGVGRPRPRPALALALVIGGLFLSSRGADHPGVERLAGIAVGGAAMMLAGLLSDARRPSSERHLLGLAVAFALAAWMKVIIPYSGMFGIGPAVSFAPVAAIIVTAGWFFLVVSIVELASLLPFLAGTCALLLGGLAWGFGPDLRDPATVALPPLIVGAVAGRALAGMLFSGGRMLEKSEVLALGFFLAAMTTLSFTKSFALASVVLPLGIAALATIILGMRAFERSLLLRPTPR